MIIKTFYLIAYIVQVRRECNFIHHDVRVRNVVHVINE